MSNPFKLYTGKEYDEESRKCTRELKKAWNEFRCRVKIIQNNYRGVGASDTESREEFSLWVKKREDKCDLMWGN